jgi:hypothetical protein
VTCPVSVLLYLVYNKGVGLHCRTKGNSHDTECAAGFGRRQAVEMTGLSCVEFYDALGRWRLRSDQAQD